MAPRLSRQCSGSVAVARRKRQALIRTLALKLVDTVRDWAAAVRRQADRYAHALAADFDAAALPIKPYGTRAAEAFCEGHLLATTAWQFCLAVDRLANLRPITGVVHISTDLRDRVETARNFREHAEEYAVLPTMKGRLIRAGTKLAGSAGRRYKEKYSGTHPGSLIRSFLGSGRTEYTLFGVLRLGDLEAELDRVSAQMAPVIAELGREIDRLVREHGWDRLPEVATMATATQPIEADDDAERTAQLKGEPGER